MLRFWISAALIFALSTPLTLGAQQPATQASAKPQLKITQGPRVEHATEKQVVIAWSTNVASSTEVKYGTDRNNLDRSAQAPWGSLTHRVTLKDLQPNTTYYFVVTSAQGQGVTGAATSALLQFTTSGAAAQQTQAAPVAPSSVAQTNIVAGPIVQNLTDSSAVLWWRTPDSTGALVRYGTDPANLNLTATDPGGSRDHKVQLTKLPSGQTIHFSVQTSANTQVASGSFKTPQNATSAGVKIINGPVLEYVGKDAAVIAWSTSAPSSGTVKFGTDAASLAQSGASTAGQTTHRVQLQSLKPGTRYYFEVQSAANSSAGDVARSGPGQFVTVAPGSQDLKLTAEN